MEITREGEAEYCVEKFLEAKRVSDKRRGKKTISYTREIVDCLSNRFEIDDKNPDIKKGDVGWVLCKDLLEAVRIEYLDIPPSTFYRILGELVTNHIIKQKKSKPGKRIKPYRPGKPPVYYRVPALHARAWFMSKEELIESFIFVLNALNRDARLINAAKHLLKQCHSNDPEYSPGKAIFLESMRILDMEKKGIFLL